MKFTHEKPTVPGAYWWRNNPNALPVLAEVGGDAAFGRWMVTVGCTDGNVDRVGGEWSPRLVSVEEVRKAFDEGFADAHGIWEDSRARRVVEGIENQ